MEAGDLFRAWMDERKLGAAEVCGLLGVSVQTIHNWRSSGVPRRRLPHVRDLMARWDALGTTPLATIVLRLGPEQFEQWSAAALASGKVLTRWAVDALDEIAACQDPRGSRAVQNVADDPQAVPAHPAVPTRYRPTRPKA